ncbi:MAG: hypothetical protein AB7I27_15670 [Bacteriovoracaceae bacterium]
MQSKLYAEGFKAISKVAWPYISFQNDIPLVVLIDDDKFTRLNWDIFCKSNSISFRSFRNIDEFLLNDIGFDPNVHIFLDSNLGENVKGETESEKIAKLGFVNLYLATGYEKESIVRPSWIVKVFSKKPENILKVLN